MKDQLSYLVQYFLKAHSINIDPVELEFQIQSHPTYPSLNAITGVLDHFNVENLAVDVPVNKDVIDQLPNTFLAQIQENNHNSFVVVVKKGEAYKLIYNQKRSDLISISDFLKLFTGIVLCIDKEDSNINNQPKSNTILKRIFTSTGLIAFILVLTQYNLNIIDVIFLSTSLIGIYITINILKQEEGEVSFLGNAFCSDVTEKKNCDAVLTSKGAIVYKDLKISDISFIYFLGISLSTVLLIIGNHSIFIPKLLTLFTLPVTLYSIYYQAYKVKKWCFLCLGIVSIMWAQSIISILGFKPNFELIPIIITFFSLSLITAFWLFQSELLKSNKALKVSKVKYFKFKRSFELFNTQLNNTQPIPTTISLGNETTFGNRQSTTNITVITNPLCGHCKSVHKLIEQILKRCSQDVKITVRFNTNLKHIDNKATQIALRLVELYHLNQDTCLEAMHDIYGDTSTADWFKKWSTCSDQEKYMETLQNHGDWCQTHSINFTPELLVNGRSYPKMYDRNDLIYFIEDLVELGQINAQEIESISKL